MRRLALLGLALPLLGQAPATSVSTTFVEVVVNGVRNANGHVLGELCTRETFLHPDCAWRAGAPAHPGSVTLRITGVPPGVYAAQVYHDENDDRQVNRNAIGIPTEGIGFSNDAKFRFGPPRWGDAAFELRPGGGRIEVTLRYF